MHGANELDIVLFFEVPVDGFIFGVFDDLDQRIGVRGKDEVAVDDAHTPFAQEGFFLFLFFLIFGAGVIEFDNLFFLFFVGEFPDSVIADVL